MHALKKLHAAARPERKSALEGFRLRAIVCVMAGLGMVGAHAANPKSTAKTKPGAHASKLDKHAKATGKSTTKRAHATTDRKDAGQSTAAVTNDSAGDTDAEQATVQQGVGSWYGKPFHGRQTASGELFNMHAFTAAHRTLPIPSFARVRNLANGKEVIVRINDRGPYVGHRVIDLSLGAAQRLGIQGLGRVRIEPIDADAIQNGKWRDEDMRPIRPRDADLEVAGNGASLGNSNATATVTVTETAGLKPSTSAMLATTAGAPLAGNPNLTETDSAKPELQVEATPAADPQLISSDPDEEGSPAEDVEQSHETPGATEAASGDKHEVERSPAHAHAQTVRHALRSKVASKEGKDVGLLPTTGSSKDLISLQNGGPALASNVTGPMMPVVLHPAPVADLGAKLAVASTGSAAREASPTKTEVQEVHAGGEKTSLLANVVAATVTPVLSGIARSASTVKDTLVSLAAPKPAKAVTKPGAVQIDPARTRNGRGWWLQLGVFEQPQNAMSFQHKVIDVAPWLGPLLGIFDERGERKLQAGPYPTREQAQSALERAREALKVNPVMVHRR